MRVCWGQSDHITWWLCWCLQLSGFPCSYNWRDYCASSLYVQRTRSVDFVCWVRFLSLFVKKVGRRIQAAGDVCCEAVGWMERSHVPQQQSGLIVGFTINLQKEKNNWILDTCFFFFFFFFFLNFKFHLELFQFFPPTHSLFSHARNMLFFFFFLNCTLHMTTFQLFHPRQIHIYRVKDKWYFLESDLYKPICLAPNRFGPGPKFSSRYHSSEEGCDSNRHPRFFNLPIFIFWSRVHVKAFIGMPFLFAVIKFIFIIFTDWWWFTDVYLGEGGVEQD